MQTFNKSMAILAIVLIVVACNNHTSSSKNFLVQDMSLKKADTREKQRPFAKDSGQTPEEEKSEESDFNTEDYNHIIENKFLAVTQQPLSTFSIDVDRAAYSNVRRYIESGSLPPKGAVRIEEMINYFDYKYEQPIGEIPFAIHTEIATCPWNIQNRLVHIGLQGKKINTNKLPSSNLVFLIDVSGSMSDENKLPLVKASLKMLTEQLREEDDVAIVVYAGNAGLVLPSTSGDKKIKIKNAIDELEAGGSTAGGEGIQLAYKVAREHLKPGGNNRVILATDGDFNVGASSDDELVSLIEKERQDGIFLTVLGYGMGNYKDNKMQELADKGNGNHAYIDNMNEARKILVNEFGGTLFAIAKDVKLQIEFNPKLVQAYRLIGYENRVMANEDFNDDKKDAGELGAGHTVTALYEIIPAGIESKLISPVDELKYQTKSTSLSDFNDELINIKMRYKKPDGKASMLIVHPVKDENQNWKNSSDNFRFSAAVAEFGLLLRNSEYKQQSNYTQVIDMASQAAGNDEEGYRNEFVQLVKKASSLQGNSGKED